MSAAGAWLSAMRPRTLSAALVPVLVGLALSSRFEAVDRVLGLATLAAALLIQVATNLANDYYDFQSGADTAERVGPLRVTQAGLFSPRTVRNAAFATLAAAALPGLWLVWVGGVPIAIIGVLSLLCALAYTGGPWPLAYKGLGDVFVFVFFGLVAVAGTVWLQLAVLPALIWPAALAVACLATAILVVNNLRDVDTDRAARKRTLVVRFGEQFTRAEYYTLVSLPFACLAFLFPAVGWGALLPLAAAPLAWSEAQALSRLSGPALNQSLASTARLHLIFGLLLAAGLAL